MLSDIMNLCLPPLRYMEQGWSKGETSPLIFYIIVSNELKRAIRGKTMVKEIKYKFAEEENGNAVFIEKAISGKKYICSDCKEEMIFKNGNIRQKHFSHKNLENCGKGTGEGYLHATFKNLLLQYIKNCINDKKPIEASWFCNVCENKHNANLISNIADVKAEYSIENCRPDLVLIDVKGRIPIIIEIVDKHEPEKNVIDLCRKYSIILVRIKLDSLADLENFENKLKLPTNVIMFNQNQCPVVINILLQQQRIMAIQSATMPYRDNVIRGTPIDYIDKKLSNPNYRNSRYSNNRGNFRGSKGGKTSGRRK